MRQEEEQSPERGDPLKAQGAQPCKGDQTLGKLHTKGQSPTGATLKAVVKPQRHTSPFHRTRARGKPLGYRRAKQMARAGSPGGARDEARELDIA